MFALNGFKVFYLFVTKYRWVLAHPIGFYLPLFLSVMFGGVFTTTCVQKLQFNFICLQPTQTELFEQRTGNPSQHQHCFCLNEEEYGSLLR